MQTAERALDKYDIRVKDFRRENSNATRFHASRAIVLENFGIGFTLSLPHSSTLLFPSLHLYFFFFRLLFYSLTLILSPTTSSYFNKRFFFFFHSSQPIFAIESLNGNFTWKPNIHSSRNTNKAIKRKIIAISYEKNWENLIIKMRKQNNANPSLRMK